MSYLSSEERVRELARQAAPHHNGKPAPFLSAGGLRTAAVCASFERLKNLNSYISAQNEILSRASQAGCQIVAFPELSAMPVASLMPGFPAIQAELRALWDSDDRQKRVESFYEFCATVQGFIGEIFLNTFSQLARGHRMIVAAGGLYQVENGVLTNRQYLFTDTGEVSAAQDKLYPDRWERSMGVSAGKKLSPGQTPLGRVALLSASCLSDYEPFFAAAAAGCTVATAGATPFTPVSDLARYRAQESGLCLLCPGIQKGSAFAVAGSSPAMIAAPRAATRSRDGRAAGPSLQPLVTARVDLERAASQFDLYSADRNPAFFQALLDRDPANPSHEG